MAIHVHTTINTVDIIIITILIKLSLLAINMHKTVNHIHNDIIITISSD